MRETRTRRAPAETTEWRGRKGSPPTFRFDRFRRVQPQPDGFRPRPADMVRDLVASGDVQLEAL